MRREPVGELANVGRDCSSTRGRDRARRSTATTFPRRSRSGTTASSSTSWRSIRAARRRTWTSPPTATGASSTRSSFARSRSGAPRRCRGRFSSSTSPRSPAARSRSRVLLRRRGASPVYAALWGLTPGLYIAVTPRPLRAARVRPRARGSRRLVVGRPAAALAGRRPPRARRPHPRDDASLPGRPCRGGGARARRRHRTAQGPRSPVGPRAGGDVAAPVRRAASLPRRLARFGGLRPRGRSLRAAYPFGGFLSPLAARSPAPRAALERRPDRACSPSPSSPGSRGGVGPSLPRARAERRLPRSSSCLSPSYDALIGSARIALGVTCAFLACLPLIPVGQRAQVALVVAVFGMSPWFALFPDAFGR